MRNQTGFTLVELITTLMIVGILAVVAIPRMNNTEYRSNEFRDKVVSALRYAQKSAVSHRRFVCAALTTTKVSLTMDTAAAGSSCAGGQALSVPGSSSGAAESGDAGKAFFSTAMPIAYVFAPDGTSAGLTLSIPNQADIIVVGATGYVN